MQDVGILILRLSISLSMFFGHGWVKWADYAERVKMFPDPIGLGQVNSLLLTMLVEIICSILLALGIFTRWACVPLISVMSIAWYLHIVTWEDTWDKQEKAALYLVCYLTLFFTGGGKYSLERLIYRKK